MTCQGTSDFGGVGSMGLPDSVPSAWAYSGLTRRRYQVRSRKGRSGFPSGLEQERNASDPLQPAFALARLSGAIEAFHVAIQFLSLRFFFERGLRGCQSCDRDAEGRATYVGQSNAMTEFHAIGISAMFAANA